jgi:hypothetical protein
MRAHGQTVFYLDWMQPDWLPTRAQERLVTLGVAIAIGSIAALVCGLVFALAFGIILVIVTWSFRPGFVEWLETDLATAAVAGLLVSPIYGVVGGVSAFGRGITPLQQLRWSFVATRRNLRRTGGLGLIVGLLVGVVSALVIGGLATGLYFGGIAGLSVGLIASIGGGLETGPLVTPMGPGKGMESSRHSALVSGIGGGLSVLMVVALFIGLPIGTGGAGFNAAVTDGTVGGLLLGLALGLVFGLRRGGGAYLRHLALRWLLAHDGLTPSDYVAFLDHATDLILLRRRGGGYEYIHRLLLDYFASVESSVPAVDLSASHSTT